MVRRLCVFLACSAGLALSVAAAAEPTAPVKSAGRDADYDAAFAAMTQNLDDPERIFAFAEAAARAGDLTAAIASFERLLRMDQGRNNVRLELALLYARVGRWDAATAYAREALQDPNIPDFARARAIALLAEANAAQTRFAAAGALYAGALSQSNPNAAPESALVFDAFRGRTVELTADQLTTRRRDYVAAVVQLSGEASLRPSGAGGLEVAADGVVGISRYGRTEGLDADTAQVRVGPRFAPASGAHATFAFASGSALALDGDRYFTAAGLGVVHDRRIATAAVLSATAQWERRDFAASALRPRAGLQSGDYYGAALRLRREPPEGFAVGGQVALDRGEAEAGWHSFDRGDAVLSSWRRLGGLRVEVGAGYRNTRYQQPDPLVSPVITRVEDRYAVFAAVSARVTAKLRATARAEQVFNRSTLANYRFDDTSVSIGVTRPL